MATRYARETGNSFQRFIPHNLPDVLLALQKMRSAPRWSALHHNQYLPTRKRAMRPVLAQHRMIESAIRMDLQMRETLAAWRQAVAA